MDVECRLGLRARRQASRRHGRLIRPCLPRCLPCRLSFVLPAFLLLPVGQPIGGLLANPPRLQRCRHIAGEPVAQKVAKALLEVNQTISTEAVGMGALLAALLAKSGLGCHLADHDLLHRGMDGDRVDTQGVRAVGAEREHLGGAILCQRVGQQCSTVHSSVCRCCASAFISSFLIDKELVFRHVEVQS
jgi:hypothetical protein